MDQTHKEKLEYIISKFNFERVHLAMTHLDWRWINLNNNGEEFSIPTMLRLKTSARDLLSRAYSELMKRTDQSEYTCGTGGFEATCWADPENIGEFGFTLKFVLTEWDTEDYQEDFENE